MMTDDREDAAAGKGTTKPKAPVSTEQDRVDTILRNPARLAALRAMCVHGVPSGPIFERMNERKVPVERDGNWRCVGVGHTLTIMVVGCDKVSGTSPALSRRSRSLER